MKLFDGVILSSEKTIVEIFSTLIFISNTSYDTMKPMLLQNFRQLSKSSTIDTLIEMKISGCLFGICRDTKQRLNPEQWVRLRKVFNGATISVKDSILGRKLHKNMAQWFIIGDDSTAQQLQKQHIKFLRFDLPHPTDQLSIFRSAWIECILPLWGFLQLQKKRRRTESKPTMQTVQLFVEQCCKIGPTGKFLSARSLYEHYRLFCTRHDHADILLFKDFNKVLETDYGLKRCRYHIKVDGADQNQTGYRQIVYMGENGFIPQDDPKPENEMETFFRKLNQIETEVREHFTTYPF